jgi:CheY-like chemotaxis protein
VLALTASANPVDHDRCLSAGMDDVVQKPLDEQQLVAKVSSVYMSPQSRGSLL